MTDRFAAVVEKVKKEVARVYEISPYFCAKSLATEILPDITAMHEALKTAQCERDKFKRDWEELFANAQEKYSEWDSQLAAKDAEIERLKAGVKKLAGDMRLTALVSAENSVFFDMADDLEELVKQESGE